MGNESSLTVEDLKLRINNLLWIILPPNTPIHEAEKIALAWHYEVCEIWRRRNAEEDLKEEEPTHVATINRQSFMRP